MSALDELRAMLDRGDDLLDPEVHTADDVLERLIDPDPRARNVPGIGRVVEPPITGAPATSSSAPRVRVRRVDTEAGPRWRAYLRTADADEQVGLYDTQPQALMRGITAARFFAAGVPWRAEQ